MDEEHLNIIAREIGEVVVRGYATSDLIPYAEGIFEVLRDVQDDLRDGYTLWFGWGPIFLEAEQYGYTLTVPDYAQDPRVDRTEDLSIALWTLVGQAGLIDSIDVEPAEIGFDDEVIVEQGWDSAPDLELQRQESGREGDSGWTISVFSTKDRQFDPERYERIPAWKVLQLRPRVTQALTLPADTATVMAGDDVLVVFRLSDGAKLFDGRVDESDS